MDNADKPMKPSEQLLEMKENLPVKCPMAVEEAISSFARCEMVYDNCGDKVEKYFAKEAMGVLHDMSLQLLSLAAHPNIKQIVDSAPNGL